MQKGDSKILPTVSLQVPMDRYAGEREEALDQPLAIIQVHSTAETKRSSDNTVSRGDDPDARSANPISEFSGIDNTTGSSYTTQEGKDKYYREPMYDTDTIIVTAIPTPPNNPTAKNGAAVDNPVVIRTPAQVETEEPFCNIFWVLFILGISLSPVFTCLGSFGLISRHAGHRAAGKANLIGGLMWATLSIIYFVALE